MKYVIIGNGAAGMAAIEAIRNNDNDGVIDVVTEENYPAYSRPSISYLLKGKTNPLRMRLKGEDFYEANKVNCRLGVKAEKIDAQNKKVFLSDGSALDYEKLLIASGSVPFVPPMQGLKDQKNVHAFLSMKDSLGLLEAAAPHTRAVVIGGGLIGLKAAEGLAHICRSVTVIELAPCILPSILSEQAAAVVARRFGQEGVRIITGDSVTAVHGDENVERLALKSGAELPCDLLVLAVGVRPNTALAASAGCSIGRGVCADSHMMTSVADIYTAGDCAQSKDVLDGLDKVLAIWPNAVTQGKVAGDCMSGGDSEYNGGFAVNSIEFFGCSIMTCGINKGEGVGVLSYDSGDSLRRFFIKDGVLVGFMIVGRAENAGIYAELVREGYPVKGLCGELGSIGIFSFPEKIRSRKLHGGDL